MRLPSKLGLVMMRVRISCTRSNISASVEYSSSPMPYKLSALGVLPPLWSSAATKPAPLPIFSNCAAFITPSIMRVGAGTIDAGSGQP